MGTAAPQNPLSHPTRAVAIATMAKALRQAGSDLGHPPSDTLIALMLGQMLGAEGAMPGLWDGAGYTLRGTNNIGAAQVPGGSSGEAFAAQYKTTPGWGAFAHRDSNPGNDAYIGWYYIAPTAYDAAKHWLTGFAGTKNVLAQGPSNATDYATIMYHSGYFTGLTTDAATEIGKYAAAISRALPEAQGSMNGTANDPKALSVDPTMYATLTDRKVTEDLYDKAMSGKTGSAWKFMLPAQWSDLVKTNGVIWFGPPPKAGNPWLGHGLWGAGGAIAGGVLGGPLGAVVGASLLGGGHYAATAYQARAKAPPPSADPKAVQTKLNALGMAKPPLTVDGQLGPLSKAAITAFQKSKSLPATGELDAATIKALGV